MTLRYLLDTNIVSAPVAAEPNGRLVRRLEAHAHEAAIAAPVWHELIFGVAKLPRGRRRNALSAYVEEVVGATLRVLDYDQAAAAWHGRERARMERAGTPAPFVDGQIASVAYVNDLIMVTANPKDFQGFEGLVVQDWSRKRSPARPDH